MNVDGQKANFHALLHKNVKVEWEDIVAWGGWVSPEKMGEDGQKPAPITTVGTCSWVTDTYITISASYGGEGDALEYNQHISIPIGCITAVCPLD